MNLLQLLLGTLTSKDSLKQVEKKSGVSSDKVAKMLLAALPLLIAYMTKNASKKEGAQSLLGALGQHNSSQTVPQQIKTADETDGAKIIAHILGADQKNVVNTLAQQSGITTGQVNTVLNLIAPALLNSLSTATAATAAKPQENKVDLSDGIDLTDIAALLGGGSVTNTYSNPAAGLLGSLLGGGATQQQTQTQTNPTAALLTSLLGANQNQAKADGSELLGLLTSMLK
ncbi:MAG: DUF937 domain-containing protein [Erysipelotrichaceae bacterium]|nr:DUF937 domain-containing protein [Erysipelotrichaceae bacterium]